MEIVEQRFNEKLFHIDYFSPSPQSVGKVLIIFDNIFDHLILII